MLRRASLRRPLSVLTLMGIDALALLVGLEIANRLVVGENRTEQILYFAPVILVVWLTIFTTYDLYGRAPKRQNPGALLGAISLGGGLLVIGSIIYPESGFSSEEILLGIFFIILVNVVWRLLYEQG